MTYIVQHTVPVYVHVNEETGEVDEVVIDTDKLSDPKGFVQPIIVEEGWTDEDVVPFRRDIVGLPRFRDYKDRVMQFVTWPAWRKGWED